MLSFEPRHRRGLSRGCAQRVGLRRYVNRGVRDCVVSISWFAGLRIPLVAAGVTEMQHRFIEAIRIACAGARSRCGGRKVTARYGMVPSAHHSRDLSLYTSL